MAKPGKSPRRGSAGRAAPDPLHRDTWVIAQDPGVGQEKGSKSILMARVRIPAERLAPGPTGYRFQVVDYDASRRRYAGAHELPKDERSVPAAWKRGAPSIVDDPRFRAHNVYCIAMKTLSRFEAALGRRVGWAFGRHHLKIAPTGMLDANAFYSREDEGLVFGYFKGRSGKTVYACLSHDIVAHETTHAILDGLRERYLLPANPDQAAFHEGFADLVAILSVFAQREVVVRLLRPLETRGLIPVARLTRDGDPGTELLNLAVQFGQEITGIHGQALRTSAGLSPADVKGAGDEFEESHRRGEIFVAAVLRAFRRIWAERVAEEIRGRGDSTSVVHVANVGCEIAELLMTLWIRAIDYLPPSDVDFPDILSAALTADFEIRRDDARYRLRERIRESFAEFGIRPASGRRDPEPGLWDPAPEGLRYDRIRFDSLRTDRDEVFRFVWENRDRLELSDNAYTEVLTVNPSLRTGTDGFTLRETVATYYQVARLTPDELAARDFPVPAGLRRLARAARLPETGQRGADSDAPDERNGGDRVTEEDARVPIYGGGTLVFDEYGTLKYHIGSGVFGRRQHRRLAYLWKQGALRRRDRTADIASVPTDLSALHQARATGRALHRRKEW